MKYLKRFNESVLEDGEKFMSYYKDDIRDILVDFVFGYDIRYLLTDSFGYPLLQIQILPKGFPDHSVSPVLVDGDILDDFKRLVDFIKDEVGFNYSHSHYFINNNYNSMKSDLFDCRSGSLVSMIQMNFDGSD